MALNTGSIHTSTAKCAAPEARSHWLTNEWLPNDAPERKDIDAARNAIKEPDLADQTFTNLDRFARVIRTGAKTMDHQRSYDA